MDFEQRLERAIGRGERSRMSRGREDADRAVSEEDFKNLHSKVRLDLSEHIETCLQKLADYFPGFRFQTVVGEDGWGARISRDDYRRSPGRDSESRYSRLELVVRPYSAAHIVEIAGKGTVRDKEIFNRNHFQLLSQVDVQSLSELVDLWVLEYAEKYAAAG
jgi:hypothetical protein